jgi:hypothetical protein
MIGVRSAAKAFALAFRAAVAAISLGSRRAAGCAPWRPAMPALVLAESKAALLLGFDEDEPRGAASRAVKHDPPRRRVRPAAWLLRPHLSWLPTSRQPAEKSEHPRHAKNSGPTQPRAQLG